MENEKTGFAERIDGTTYTVNTMPSEGAKQTAEELVRAMITREVTTVEDDTG